MSKHILCIGGEDHNFRIPFLLGLRNLGFRVTAAGTGDGAPFAKVGIDYHAFRFHRFTNPAGDLSAIRQIRAMISDVRPDVVQSFDTKPNLLVPLAARGLRAVQVVRTINGMGWVFSSRGSLALMLRPAYCWLHRLAARSTTLTVFQNREDQTFFADRGMAAPDRHRLIAGSGVDVERFEAMRLAGPSRDELRETLGLADCEVVMTVTRLTRQKGIATLLAAADQVRKVRPNVRFVLVGPLESEGPMAVTKAEIDAHAPHVVWVGPQTNVPAYLAAADVFAFPTEYREGVPRVLLEASLARLPMVTTRMPGCTDVVEDGLTGLLVPERSPKLLASGIVQLLTDRKAAAAMGQRARERVIRDFSLELTLHRYSEAYRELLSHPPGETARDDLRSAQA